MRLKSINHQSNSLGSLTHELKGRTRGGKCQDSFQRTLSMSCSDWEENAGSLPTKVCVCVCVCACVCVCLRVYCRFANTFFNQFSLAGLKRQH